MLFVALVLGSYLIGSFVAFDLNTDNWRMNRTEEWMFNKNHQMYSKYTTDYINTRLSIIILLVMSVIISLTTYNDKESKDGSRSPGP